MMEHRYCDTKILWSIDQNTCVFLSYTVITDSFRELDPALPPPPPLPKKKPKQAKQNKNKKQKTPPPPPPPPTTTTTTTTTNKQAKANK